MIRLVLSVSILTAFFWAVFFVLQDELREQLKVGALLALKIMSLVCVFLVALSLILSLFI